MRWLHAPYDGGADVIAASPATGTSSSARTRTGCLPTPQDCDTPGDSSGPPRACLKSGARQYEWVFWDAGYRQEQWPARA